MPQYSMKICTYDPAIIDAFDRLRKNRKHAAFSQEALKYFLSTEKGRQVLLLMEGKMTEPIPATISLPADKPSTEIQTERIVTTSHSTFASQSNSSSVLGSILE